MRILLAVDGSACSDAAVSGETLKSSVGILFLFEEFREPNYSSFPPGLSTMF